MGVKDGLGPDPIIAVDDADRLAKLKDRSPAQQEHIRAAAGRVYDVLLERLGGKNHLRPEG